MAFVLRPSSRRAPTKTEESKNTENKPEQASSTKTNSQVDGREKTGESGAEVPEQSVEGGGEQSVAEVGEHSGEAGEDGEEEIINIAPPWGMNQEEVRSKHNVVKEKLVRRVYLEKRLYVCSGRCLYWREAFILERCLYQRDIYIREMSVY